MPRPNHKSSPGVILAKKLNNATKAGEYRQLLTQADWDKIHQKEIEAMWRKFI